MALSRVMASTTMTSTNSDLPRQIVPSLCSPLPTADQAKAFGSSISMDDLLKNIYADSFSPDAFPSSGNGVPADGAPRQGYKTADDVWKEIVAGNEQRSEGIGMTEEVTLEDFLTKAGAVREEDVRVPVLPDPGNYGVDSSSASSAMNGAAVAGGGQFHNHHHQMQAHGVDGSMMVFGNGIDGRMVASGVGGRGKRRTVEEPVDKATQQKQRRMIKNRESAARSRERKQAYTVELESMVTHLVEENARLLREEAEQRKKRYKELMEKLIPVVEQRKPPRLLRRVRSMEW